MDSGAAAVIAASIGGGVAVIAGSVDRWYRRREELRRAAAAYLSALDDVSLVWQQFPKSIAEEGSAPRGAAKISEVLDSVGTWLAAVIGHEAIQTLAYLFSLPVNRRVEAVFSRVAEAQNRFLLLAPSYVRPMLDEAHGVTRRWAATLDPALSEEWYASRPKIEKAVREALRPPWTRLALRLWRRTARLARGMRRTRPPVP
jgi:hypothetical protein